MAGKCITKQQVKLYMKFREEKTLTQASCAAKSGISTRSAYTIEQGIHHTQYSKRQRAYKTRASAIDEIWENELVKKLEDNPELQPKTLLLYLQRTHVDESGASVYDDSHLRTLQRRVAHWKAMNGSPKDVIFPQVHLPGQQSLSDFTHMDRSQITIGGVVFKHMLYHFRLVYSKWSYVKVIQSGESFQALSQGLQEALFQLGGTTKEHRTDSLSAAFKNLTEEAKEDLTKQYEALCAHYGMIPTRNNKGVSHENGSVESSHGHLKNRLAQELLLRGSNDFNSITEYEAWVQHIVLQNNRRNAKQLMLEKEALQPLPQRKVMDYELISINVSSLSTIIVKKMTYSVPSRLAGHTLTLHLYQHTIEAYLGGSHTLSLIRKYRHEQATRYVIDYRHIIHALIKKPRAFRFCQYQNEILPNDAYRQIWQYLDATESRDVAPKIMLRLLKLACDHACEEKIGQHVLLLIDKKEPINIQLIESLFNRHNPRLPTLDCQQHFLGSYDNYIPTFNHSTEGDLTHAIL